MFEVDFYQLVLTHVKKNKLPEYFINIPKVESSLTITARSKAGAVGPWQINYITAKELNLQVNYYLDERLDPIKATQSATFYLAYLKNKFKSDKLTLLAYNCGPNKVFYCKTDYYIKVKKVNFKKEESFKLRYVPVYLLQNKPLSAVCKMYVPEKYYSSCLINNPHILRNIVPKNQIVNIYF